MPNINKNILLLTENYLFDEVEARVNELNDRDIINLGVGDATNPLTPCVFKAFKKAAAMMGKKSTFKGYPPICGHDFLKKAVSDRYKRLSVDVAPYEVFISDGAKTDLYAALSCFGKLTALIKNPVYPAYLDENISVGNDVIFVRADKANGFLPTPCDIASSGALKNLLIYICSPDNPTGAVYDRKKLKQWVDFALKSCSLILFDAAYESFIRGDYPRSCFEIEGAESCCIEVCSLSKSANFAGLRCGYTVIKNQLMVDGVRLNSVFRRIKGLSYNGVSYPVQVAASAALSAVGDEECRINTQYYLDNAKILKAAITSAGVYSVGGENSPYVFFECPPSVSSAEFFDSLIVGAKIVATPGIGFNSGGEGFMRITGFSTRRKTMLAASRLKKFLSGQNYRRF